MKMFLWGLTLVAMGSVGLDQNTWAASHYDSNSVGVLDTSITGGWIETLCRQGEMGPDLPPPKYFKGVIKFVEPDTLILTSQLFDDEKCIAKRPVRVTENTAHYSVVTPSVTTDESIQIDIQAKDERGEAYTLYGVMKKIDGKLYLQIYYKDSTRPKSLERYRAMVLEPL